MSTVVWSLSTIFASTGLLFKCDFLAPCIRTPQVLVKTPILPPSPHLGPTESEPLQAWPGNLPCNKLPRRLFCHLPHLSLLLWRLLLPHHYPRGPCDEPPGALWPSFLPGSLVSEPPHPSGAQRSASPDPAHLVPPTSGGQLGQAGATHPFLVWK